MHGHTMFNFNMAKMPGDGCLDLDLPVCLNGNCLLLFCRASHFQDVSRFYLIHLSLDRRSGDGMGWEGFSWVLWGDGREDMPPLFSKCVSQKCDFTDGAKCIDCSFYYAYYYGFKMYSPSSLFRFKLLAFISVDGSVGDRIGDRRFHSLP